MKDEAGNELKVGDIVTTYYKGYYRIVGVNGRVSHCYDFIKVADTKGNIINGKKVETCASIYINLITKEYTLEQYEKDIKQISKKKDNLLKLMES
jgi:hypothetical protein